MKSSIVTLMFFGLSTGAALADEAACEKRARIDIDWVFSDNGAHNTFMALRSAGKSAFDAVLGAQAHNPPVQANLQTCRAWALAYLGDDIVSRNADEPVLKEEACSCISVTPGNGLRYNVTNTCQPFNVSVGFTDALNDTLSSWVSAGTVSKYTPIWAPSYKVPSIAGIRVANNVSSYTCLYNAAPSSGQSASPPTATYTPRPTTLDVAEADGGIVATSLDQSTADSGFSTTTLDVAAADGGPEPQAASNESSSSGVDDMASVAGAAIDLLGAFAGAYSGSHGGGGGAIYRQRTSGGGSPTYQHYRPSDISGTR